MMALSSSCGQWLVEDELALTGANVPSQTVRDIAQHDRGADVGPIHNFLTAHTIVDVGGSGQ
jgi:hypothetical protein